MLTTNMAGLFSKLLDNTAYQYKLCSMNRIGDNLVHWGSNEQLVRALCANDVEFVVIGGLAVSWYCAERQADDLDILVNPTIENSARAVRAMGDLGYHGYADRSFAKAGVGVSLKAQSLYADLLTPKQGGPTYSEIAESAVPAKLLGIPVQLASPAMLIRLKEMAITAADDDIRKHREDIEMLNSHAA